MSPKGSQARPCALGAHKMFVLGERWMSPKGTHVRRWSTEPHATSDRAGGALGAGNGGGGGEVSKAVAIAVVGVQERRGVAEVEALLHDQAALIWPDCRRLWDATRPSARPDRCDGVVSDPSGPCEDALWEATWAAVIARGGDGSGGAGAAAVCGGGSMGGGGGGSAVGPPEDATKLRLFVLANALDR